MIMNKRNAVIMAAGTASRFVPLSAECPKGLLEVKGEILIERQICQLKEAGIDDITIVVGYKAEMFEYLKPKYGVDIVFNEDFNRYNNTSSIIRVLDKLSDTYICSSDNYFPKNVFLEAPSQSYYSALYSDGMTNEYCIKVDENDQITEVMVGGTASWYMVGHVYFTKDFSLEFSKILAAEYKKEETRLGYWEDVYIRYIQQLPLMKIRRYEVHDIEEFDSIDELRLFDDSYTYNTRSSLVKSIAFNLGCSEKELTSFKRLMHDKDYLLFTFLKGDETYLYNERKNTIERYENGSYFNSKGRT